MGSSLIIKYRTLCSLCAELGVEENTGVDDLLSEDEKIEGGGEVGLVGGLCQLGVDEVEKLPEKIIIPTSERSSPQPPLRIFQRWG